MSRSAPEHVICMQGDWLDGTEAGFLRKRLSGRYGYLTHRFGFRSMRSSLDESVDALAQFVEAEIPDADDVICHFVAHGLAGIVMLHYLEQRERAQAGHAVCLGTPLHPLAAQRVALLPGDDSSLAMTLQPEVLARITVSRKRARHIGRIGVIAGTHCGAASGRHDSLATPNDGVVAVEETKAPFVDEHLQVAAAHWQLCCSHEITDQIAHFLSRGEFRDSVSEVSR